MCQKRYSLNLCGCGVWVSVAPLMSSRVLMPSFAVRKRVLSSRRREHMVGVNMVLAEFIQFWRFYASTMFTPTMFSRGRSSHAIITRPPPIVVAVRCAMSLGLRVTTIYLFMSNSWSALYALWCVCVCLVCAAFPCAWGISYIIVIIISIIIIIIFIIMITIGMYLSLSLYIYIYTHYIHIHNHIMVYHIICIISTRGATSTSLCAVL